MRPLNPLLNFPQWKQSRSIAQSQNISTDNGQDTEHSHPWKDPRDCFIKVAPLIPPPLVLHSCNFVISTMLYKWNHLVWNLLIGFSPFSRILWRFIQVVCTSTVSFYYWVVLHDMMDPSLFSHSPTRGPRGCFQFLAIMNDFITSMCEHISTSLG